MMKECVSLQSVADREVFPSKRRDLANDLQRDCGERVCVCGGVCVSVSDEISPDVCVWCVCE